jgi:hypothetical protein
MLDYGVDRMRNFYSEVMLMFISGSGSGRSVILFMTHKWSKVIQQRFFRIQDEMGADYDCFVLLQDDGAGCVDHWVDALVGFGGRSVLHVFCLDRLEAELGFKYFRENKIVPGSAHFPVLDFFASHDYRHYWLIEYDVEYRGSWGTFFASFDDVDADLLASHVQTFRQSRDWCWWDSVTAPSDDIRENRMALKAFLPIYRISSDGLMCVRDAHLGGWRGHFEALVPSVLSFSGLRVSDFNQIAFSYLPGGQDIFFDPDLQSSVRAYPGVGIYEFSKRAGGHVLFHPVKDEWTYCSDGALGVSGEIVPIRLVHDWD